VLRTEPAIAKLRLRTKRKPTSQISWWVCVIACLGRLQSAKPRIPHTRESSSRYVIHLHWIPPFCVSRYHIAVVLRDSSALTPRCQLATTGTNTMRTSCRLLSGESELRCSAAPGATFSSYWSRSRMAAPRRLMSLALTEPDGASGNRLIIVSTVHIGALIDLPSAPPNLTREGTPRSSSSNS
jgi:hypothetical protein